MGAVIAVESDVERCGVYEATAKEDGEKADKETKEKENGEDEDQRG